MKAWTELTAADVMSSPVKSLDSDVSLASAAEFLTEERISGAPVLGTDGRPKGVVSFFDILREVSGLERAAEARGGFYSYEYPKAEEAEEAWGRAVRSSEEDPLKVTTVGDIMTAEIIAVLPATPLPDVIRTMHRRHVHRVLVGTGGKLQGVISTFDVLGALAAGKPAVKSRVSAKKGKVGASSK